MYENMEKWGIIPSFLKERKYETTYTRKAEYAKDKFINITYTHVWNTGEEYISHIKTKYFEQAKNNEELRTFLLNEEKRRDEYIKSGGQRNSLIKRIGSKAIEVLIDIIDKDVVVFRIFEFRTPVPKENEIKLIKEVKRIFVAEGKIWSEFPNEDTRFYWEEKNYKKAMSSFLRKKSTHIRIMYGKHKSENPDNRVSRATMKAYLMSSLSKAMNNILVSEHIGNWCDFKSTDGKLSQCPKEIIEYNKKIVDFDTPIFDNDANILRVFSKRVVCQNIKDNVYVLRYFAKNNISDDVFEYARVFINNEDFYPCYFHNGKINKCNIRREEFWSTQNNIDIPLQNTVFNKRYPNINVCEDKSKIYHAIEMKKYLWAEQLAKIGFQDIINQNIVKQINKIVFSEYGHKNTQDMSINDLFGKKIVKRLMLLSNEKMDFDKFSNYLYFLMAIKEINDMSICLNVVKNIDCLHDSLAYVSELASIFKERLSKTETIRLVKSIVKHFSSIENINHRNYIVSDTYKAINRAFIEDDEQFIKECKKFSKIIKYSKITEEHNRYSALVKCSKLNNVSFAKIKKKYEDIIFQNEKYIIVLPESGNDIVMEGSRMHHCVGGYIDSIIDGRCFILFMRKKENIEKEYVTIEIRNKTICQVKCKNNFSLSSESALKFLEDWIKQKKLDVSTSDINYNNGKVGIATYSWKGLYLMEDDSVIPKEIEAKKFKTNEEIENVPEIDWDIF